LVAGKDGRKDIGLDLAEDADAVVGDVPHIRARDGIGPLDGTLTGNDAMDTEGGFYSRIALNQPPTRWLADKDTPKHFGEHEDGLAVVLADRHRHVRVGATPEVVVPPGLGVVDRVGQLGIPGRPYPVALPQ